MTLQTQLLTAAEFDQLQDPWNALLDRSACDSVFLRWEWIHIWWDIFKQNRTLFILTTRRKGELIGIAPFYIEPAGLLGTRYLKICSDELSPDYMDIIAEKGEEAEVAAEIVKFIRQHNSEWDVLTLDHLRAESPLLAKPSLFDDYAHAAQVSQRCPYIRIEGSFEDYCQPRHDLLSYSHAKKWKRLQEKENVTLLRVKDESQLSKGIDDLFRLHALRAGSKKMRSNFMSSDVQRFHQTLSAYFLREGILNFQLLFQGETAISALYAFNYRNRVNVYQTGYDPAWSKYSAGMVQWDLAVQHAFAEGFKEFDFLKGAESYKNLWSNALRDEMQLIVYNKTWRGSFWRVKRDLKSVLLRRPLPA